MLTHVMMELFVDLIINILFGIFADTVDLSDEEQQPAASGPSSGSDSRQTESAMEPSPVEVNADVAVVEAIKPVVYPSLPEEPENKSPGACRVGIRFPDGSRSNRRFLMSDSVKVFQMKTWSHFIELLLVP